MKFKILFILFIFFSFSVKGLAQNLKGLVLSEINGNSLEGVTIKVKDSDNYSISNKDGLFNIKLPKPFSVLIFTHVGYSQYELKLDSSNEYRVIKLTPEQIQLKEVIISNKKLNAHNYLKRVLSKVDSIYQNESKLITGFYSESLLMQDTLRDYSEAVFQTLKYPYHIHSNTPIYILRKQNVKDSTVNFTPDILQGVGLVHFNDFIQKRDSIFDQQFFNKTSFTFSQNNLDYDFVCIDFKSKKGNSYYGRFVLNAEGDAIVNITLTRNFGKHQKSHTVVDYGFFNGKYDLKAMEKTIFNGRNKVISKLHIINKDKQKDEIEASKLYVQKQPLRTYSNDSSRNFWKEYDDIPRDSLLKNEIKQIGYRNSNYSSHKIKGLEQITSTFTNFTFATKSNFKLDLYAGNKLFNQIDRIANHSLSSKIKNEGISSFTQLVLPEMLNSPLRNSLIEYQYLKTHHLSPKINPLVFNSYGRSYLFGITISALNEFKNQAPSDFLRIYTLRDENNYAAIKELEQEIFEKDLDKYNGKEEFLGIYFMDLLNRRLKQFGGIVFSSLFSSKVSNSKFTETPINLNPILSYTYYMHRNQHAFMGNITKNDLSESEKRFLTRIKIKSIMNLISPFMIASPALNITDEWKMNFSLNYMLIPFGEYYEEKIYLKFKDNNFGLFFKQYENYYHMGFGITLKHNQNQLLKGIGTDTELSYFRQPRYQQFYNQEFKNGFAWNQTFLFNPFIKQDGLQKVKFMIGFIAKTDGYIPESYTLKKDLSIFFGLKVHLKKDSKMN